MSECQTKAGNRECFWKLENLKTWKPENFENTKNDPWDMPNNFCFHVYAQKSLFIAENCNAFFLTSASAASAACEFRVSRAGSQLKIVIVIVIPANHVCVSQADCHNQH